MDLLSKLESMFGYHVHDPDVTKGCVTTKITGFSSSRRRQPPLIWNRSGAYWEVCRQISCVRCCWQSDSPRILRSTASHKDSVAEDWQVTPSASCRADLIDRTPVEYPPSRENYTAFTNHWQQKEAVFQ